MGIGHSEKLHGNLLNKCGFAISFMLLIYVVILLAGTLIVAVERPLWTDELYTYYIATLPSISDVWSALLSGHEQTPLGFYAIERLSLGVLGTNSAALRLPALLGCLVMSLSLFSFVSHRLTPAYGLLAAMFPMMTTAYDYAREARPYGLELGFAALALVCWQRATESDNRLAALIGLWLSLAAAISCHYYGVLIVLPLVFGELLRTIARKRIDFAIWACFAGSALPLLPMLPLIQTAAKLSGDFWAPPNWLNVASFYNDLMYMTALPLVAVVTIGVVAARFSRPAPAVDSPAANTTFPTHELGAIIGFIALPFAGMLLAKFVTHAFTNRYVVVTVVGLGVLFSQAMYTMLRGEFRAAALIALLLVAWFGLLEVRQARAAAHLRDRLETSTVWLQTVDREDLPIVVADPHTFIELSHYAPPVIASHLVYLADPDFARRLLGFSSLERGMLELIGPWFHMNVVPFEQFANSKAPFLIYGYPDLQRFSWVIPALKDRGFRIELQSSIDDRYLFLATPSDR